MKRKKKTKLYLDIYINGRWKVSYTLCATKLRTIGPEWVDNGTCCGDGARLKIDIPVTVS